MTQLHPQELAQFARKYRFADGRRSGVRVRTRGTEVTVEVTLRVKAAMKDLGGESDAVRLKLRVVGAEEYRFQKRPNSPAGKISDVKFGYFHGLFFVNFDAWGLQPGEAPGVHDFRASDAFVAGRELHWEEVGPGPR